MFNNHENAFYMFEPLHPWVETGCAKSTRQSRLDFLGEMLSCNIKDRYNTSIPWKEYQKTHQSNAQSLDQRGNFIFRSKVKRLCAPPFCDVDLSNSTDRTKCAAECAPVDSQLARDVCIQKTPVAKTIRLCSITDLEETSKNNNLDLRIIFLARDPRGILQSKVGLYNTDNDKKETKKIISGIENVCRSTNLILEDIEKDRWLKKHTLVIRYEDIAINPLQSAQRIMEHTGLDLSEKVTDWIHQNTNVEVTNNTKIDLKYRYSTKRDSKQAAFSWRNTIREENVESLEELCSEEMKKLGYVPFSKLSNESDPILPLI